MGHKVNPIGFRLGVVKGWQSRWYAEHDYKDILGEDFLIRRVINKDLFNAAVSRIEIERAATNQVLVKIHTAKPGIVIGKNGEKVDKLRAHLESETKKRVRLEILEIRQPELDATLVGRSIAEQLEKRVSFRRAMKQAVQKTMRANAKGIRILVGGRLGGAEIARSEKEVEGKVPLHTLRADIDYGLTEAHTTFGVIGIKVWIYRGDILPTKRREAIEGQQDTAAQPFTQRDERRGERGDRGERRGGGERRDFNAPRGDRSQGERGQRPQGDRSQGDRPRGDRGPRPQGDRPQRPQGQGDRPQRPQGDRGPRPQGQSGERGPREVRAEQAAQSTREFPAPQTMVPPVTQPEATRPEATPPTASAAPVTPSTPTAPEAPASDTSATQGE